MYQQPGTHGTIPSDFGGQLNFDNSPLGPPITMPAPPKAKGGMFGGQRGRAIAEALLAGLNGYLAARGNPVGIQGLQALQARRQSALEEAQYQQRRGEHFDDWVRQQAWKQANPDQANPHYFESNAGDVYSITPGQQPEMRFRDPFRYKLIPNGLGGVVPVSIEQLMGGQGGRSAPEGVTFTPIDDGGPPHTGAGGFRY